MKYLQDSTTFVRNQAYDENVEPDRFAPMTGKNNYRSGRIVSEKQLAMLKKRYGIKRIINLAKDSMINQYDATVPCRGEGCEEAWANRLGIEYHPFYLSSRPPSENDWSVIKALLQKGDTLVHCTWGVDRTGAVVGAWRKTVEPNLSVDDMLNYTYAFGGQWRMQEDPNRHLRNWMVNVQYDPQFPVVKKKLQWWMYVSVGVISIPLMLYLLKKNKVI